MPFYHRLEEQGRVVRNVWEVMEDEHTRDVTKEAGRERMSCGLGRLGTIQPSNQQGNSHQNLGGIVDNTSAFWRVTVSIYVAERVPENS